MRVLILMLTLFMTTSANAITYNELKEKMKTCNLGQAVTCFELKYASKIFSSSYISKIAKKCGATEEQVQQKKQECGVK